MNRKTVESIVKNLILPAIGSAIGVYLALRFFWP